MFIQLPSVPTLCINKINYIYKLYTNNRVFRIKSDYHELKYQWFREQQFTGNCYQQNDCASQFYTQSEADLT